LHGGGGLPLFGGRLGAELTAKARREEDRLQADRRSLSRLPE
jgi:hypothetical protein